MLLPNLLFSSMEVCLLGEVACYSDCSSIHSFDYSNYSASLSPDSGSDRCYPHTDLGSSSDSYFIAPLFGPTRLVDPNRFRDANLILLFLPFY